MLCWDMGFSQLTQPLPSTCGAHKKADAHGDAVPGLYGNWQIITYRSEVHAAALRLPTKQKQGSSCTFTLMLQYM